MFHKWRDVFEMYVSNLDTSVSCIMECQWLVTGAILWKIGNLFFIPLVSRKDPLGSGAATGIVLGLCYVERGRISLYIQRCMKQTDLRGWVQRGWCCWTDQYHRYIHCTDVQWTTGCTFRTAEKTQNTWNKLKKKKRQWRRANTAIPQCESLWWWALSAEWEMTRGTFFPEWKATTCKEAIVMVVYFTSHQPSSSLLSRGTLQAIRFRAARPSSATIFRTLSWLLERWKDACRGNRQVDIQFMLGTSVD